MNESLLLPGPPTAAVAIATLVAAGVFMPALGFVCAGVDRVCDRSRHLGFGDRIRTGQDPQGSGADLTDAFERTLQPGAVGPWSPKELW